MSSKIEKERQKLIQEKCQSMLNEMLRDEDNKYCVDCDAKGPRWASWNLGIFLCIRCAGIHRNLGVHISKVKSVNLDTWTPDQVVSMTGMGNSRARAVYEANLPDSFRRPQTDVSLENFIRAKYEHKKYIAKEFVPSPPPKADWNAEIEETIRSKKSEKKVSVTLPICKPGRVAGGPKKEVTPVPVQLQVTQQVTQEKTNSELLFSLEETTPTNNIPETTPPTDLSDLGAVFNTTTPTLDQQKLTKESILSLYSNTSNPFTQPTQLNQVQSTFMGLNLGQQQQPPPQQQRDNFWN